MHKPLSNAVLLFSIVGFIVSLYVWSFSTDMPELIPWLFLFMIFFVILFIASFISAVKAPLANDYDIALAIHEEYKNRRYPDTPHSKEAFATKKTSTKNNQTKKKVNKTAKKTSQKKK